MEYTKNGPEKYERVCFSADELPELLHALINWNMDTDINPDHIIIELKQPFYVASVYYYLFPEKE